MMWHCGKCGESVDDSFVVCWNCGTSKDGIEDPTFQKRAARDQVRTPDEGSTRSGPIACLRCNQELEHVGTKRFHQGTNWGVLGELGELFVKRDRFDVYVCPRCGRAEFFFDGVGEEHRPQ
jgi:DNA-directed RNA polymerase subunit RPC12/RpoP